MMLGFAWISLVIVVHYTNIEDDGQMEWLVLNLEKAGLYYGGCSWDNQVSIRIFERIQTLTRMIQRLYKKNKKRIRFNV